MSQPVETAIGTQNVGFLETLYEEYQRDPASVPADFRAYFDSLGKPPGPSQLGPSFKKRGYFGTKRNGASAIWRLRLYVAGRTGKFSGARTDVAKPRS